MSYSGLIRHQGKIIRVHFEGTEDMKHAIEGGHAGWRTVDQDDMFLNMAKKAGRGILGWFPSCRCVMDMVWDKDMQTWASFSGPATHIHYEKPLMWREMPLPPNIKDYSNE